MAEIVFLRGISEIQCLIYQQNNVNPFEIFKNWIQLNRVFRVIIIFLGNIKISFLPAILVILCIITCLPGMLSWGDFLG